MAWTSPRTWTTTELVTAALLNSHLRDNLNFLASTTSDTEPNSRTFTNTGYLDLDALTGGAGSITAVSVSVDTGTAAIVCMSAELNQATAGQVTFMSYRISGATTVAASDTWAAYLHSPSASVGGTPTRVRRHTGLNAGTNVFEVQARVSGGTGTIAKIDLTVTPLP